MTSYELYQFVNDYKVADGRILSARDYELIEAAGELEIGDSSLDTEMQIVAEKINDQTDCTFDSWTAGR